MPWRFKKASSTKLRMTSVICQFNMESKVNLLKCVLNPIQANAAFEEKFNFLIPNLCMSWKLRTNAVTKVEYWSTLHYVLAKFGNISTRIRKHTDEWRKSTRMVNQLIPFSNDGNVLLIVGRGWRCSTNRGKVSSRNFQIMIDSDRRVTIFTLPEAEHFFDWNFCLCIVCEPPTIRQLCDLQHP